MNARVWPGLMLAAVMVLAFPSALPAQCATGCTSSSSCDGDGKSFCTSMCDTDGRCGCVDVSCDGGGGDHEPHSVGFGDPSVRGVRLAEFAGTVLRARLLIDCAWNVGGVEVVQDDQAVETAPPRIPFVRPIVAGLVHGSSPVSGRTR